MMRFTTFAVAGAVLTLLATGCETDTTDTIDELGNAGTGGTATGGTSSGGTGGTATGGTATGGTATGGTATGGTATGGGGNQDNMCWTQLSPAPTPDDVCGTCQFNKCCDELIACIPGGGACGDLIKCASEACGSDNQCLNDTINEAANGQGDCAPAATEQAVAQLLAMYGNDGCTAVTCGTECTP